MSKICQNISVSLVASAALISLSGCSMISTNPDTRVGRANVAVFDASAKIWKRTKHVFRYSEDDTVVAGRTTNVDETAYEDYQDQVDLALMETDQLQTDQLATDQLATDQANQQQKIAVATATLPAEQPILVEIPASTKAPDKVINVLPEPDAAPATEYATVRDLTFRSDDYTHVVAENESLWVLSKSLTGDATNWRILAELNNLDDNGNIYPGQSLHIPADMAVGKGIPAIAIAKPAIAKPAEEAPAQALIATAANVETTIVIPKTESVAIDKSVATAAVAEIVVAEAKPAVAPTPYEGPTTLFGVQAGETMWDLAKRSTGDATNWKSIAAANNMTEKEAGHIRYGQKIAIPNELLKKAQSASSEIEPANITQSTESAISVAEAAPTGKPVEIPTSGAETVALKNVEQELTRKIEILPAKFKTDPPVTANTKDATAEAASADGNDDWVMVSGTYYPKAIYNDANFSASLLMRVSPGTKLLVSKAVGPWFEVKTDRGIGYVHSRDIK